MFQYPHKIVHDLVLQHNAIVFGTRNPRRCSRIASQSPHLLSARGHKCTQASSTNIIICKIVSFVSVGCCTIRFDHCASLRHDASIGIHHALNDVDSFHFVQIYIVIIKLIKRTENKTHKLTFNIKCDAGEI